MKLSNAQLNLLAEVLSGEARYVRTNSLWVRSLNVLKRQGLVATSYAYGSWVETEITEAGLDALSASDPEQGDQT